MYDNRTIGLLFLGCLVSGVEAYLLRRRIGQRGTATRVDGLRLSNMQWGFAACGVFLLLALVQRCSR